MSRLECPLPDCTVSFANRTTLVKHLARQHGGAVHLTASQLDSVGLRRCLLCDKVANGVLGLKQHVGRSHGGFEAGKDAAVVAAFGADDPEVAELVAVLSAAHGAASDAEEAAGASSVEEQAVDSAAAAPGAPHDAQHAAEAEAAHRDGAADADGVLGLEAGAARPPAMGGAADAAHDAAEAAGAAGEMPGDGSGGVFRLSLLEVSRLPPHRDHLDAPMRSKFVAAARRISEALVADPTNEQVSKFFFALPKLGLAGYHGKEWRKAANYNLAVYPRLLSSEWARAAAWTPAGRAAAAAEPEDAEADADRRVKRCIRAAHGGSMQKAAQALWGDKLAVHNADTLRRLQDLHPDEPQVPPRVGGFPAAPSVPADAEEWQKAARRLPRYSAPGPSGWTYELLRACIEEAGEPFIQALRVLFAGWWHGNGILRSWWLACRLIALDKGKGDGSVRPIACADAVYRYAMRTLLARVDVDSIVPRWQLGVGVSGGVDAVVHALRQRLRLGWRVVELDFKNAFNCLSRRRMIAALERLARGPEGSPAAKSLVRAARYAYGAQTKLLVQMADGSVQEVLSRTGVRQGDPLAMLLFAVGLGRLMDEAAVASLDGVTMLAIADDVYLLLDPASPESWSPRRDAALLRINTSAGAWGMTLERDKCHTLSQEELEARAQAHKALGAVFGESNAVKLVTRDIFVKWIERLHWMTRLPSQLALLLLRWVIQSGVGHLLRIMPPSVIQAFAGEFDNATGKALFDLLRRSPTWAVATGRDEDEIASAEEEFLGTIARGHPTRFYGLGVRSVSNQSHPYAASLLGARVALEARGIVWLCAGPTAAEDVALLEQAATVLSSSVRRLAASDAALVVKAQRSLAANLETETVLRELLHIKRDAAQARRDGDAERAAAAELHLAYLLEQCSPVARAWVRAQPMAGASVQLSDTAVATGIALRANMLGCLEGKTPCVCNAIATDGAPSLRHATACSYSSVTRTRRHNVVRDHLEQAWRSQGVAVEKEARIQGTSFNSDVFVDNTDHIDVAVVGLPEPPEAGFQWPEEGPARLAVASLNGLPPRVGAAVRDLEEARVAVRKDAESKASEPTMLPSRAGPPGSLLDAKAALTERRGQLALAGAAFAEEIANGAAAPHWSGPGLRGLFLAALEAATADPNAVRRAAGDAANQAKALAQALLRPHDAARRWVQAMTAAAWGPTLRRKAADKRRQGAKPAVVSTLGVADELFDDAWPGPATTGAGLNTRNMRLSCELLNGCSLLLDRNTSVNVG